VRRDILALALALPSCNSPAPSPHGQPVAQVLSSFVQLKGGAVSALAPGDRIVALHPAVATWWERDRAVEAALPNIPVGGSRWLDEHRLRVGLGSLELQQRAWLPEPGLQMWNQPARPASEVAWIDGATVAIVEGPAPQPVDRATVERRIDLVVASADGTLRARRAIDARVNPKLAASPDRLLVAGADTRLFDLDVHPIAGPAGLPAPLRRVASGEDLFVGVGFDDVVTLIRPRDGAILATWRPTGQLLQAVPIAHGVIAADVDGTVRVGCLESAEIHVAATARVGRSVLDLQVVGDRLVVDTGGADPIQWATFVNPCR
jgi:hypothetical protein